METIPQQRLPETACFVPDETLCGPLRLPDGTRSLFVSGFWEISLSR